MKKIDIDSIRITNAEFKSRIGRIQDALKEKKLDGLLVFASEAEPANVRYLADYWPSFETTGVLVPAEGKPCLLIGPESLTFAKSRSRIPDIRRLMDFRESSQPEYPGSKLTQWRDLLGEFKIGKLGITGMAMLPYPIWNNISAVLGEGNVASEETIVPGMRIIKSPAELQLLRGGIQDIRNRAGGGPEGRETGHDRDRTGGGGGICHAQGRGRNHRLPGLVLLGSQFQPGHQPPDPPAHQER
jgi:Xaa-Pro aminopeptidase